MGNLWTKTNTPSVGGWRIEGDSMKYKYVEIELNGTITAKRIPENEIKHDKDGFVNYESIREYFRQLGYKVGYLRIC